MNDATSFLKSSLSIVKGLRRNVNIADTGQTVTCFHLTLANLINKNVGTIRKKSNIRKMSSFFGGNTECVFSNSPK